MKYAFIVGSNAFIVPGRVIIYRDGGLEKEFLRINAIHHDSQPGAEQAIFDIDLNITDDSGMPIILISNKPVANLPYTVKTEPDNVQVLRQDGSTLIQIHQLRDDAALSLEHNISAELDVAVPVVAIRITGQFLLGSLHISAQNEKLFVNGIGYAGSVLHGANQLTLTAEGVEL
jgi:hypothetical protein